MISISDRFKKTSSFAVKETVIKDNIAFRAHFLSSLRKTLEAKNFLEVDTPILRYYEDSTDTPLFVTLGPGGWPRLHLRTCPEEYVRRIAGVFGQVFEIAKSFRNEPISSNKIRTHLLEFTIVEIHKTHIDVFESMELLKSVLRDTLSSLGKLRVRRGALEIDFSVPFQRINVLDALEKYGGSDAEVEMFVNKHRKCAVTFIPGEDKKLHDYLDRFVRPHLIQPTFLIHFPTSADQISVKCIKNEALRAEFDVAGMEVGEVAQLQNDTSILRQHISQAIKDRHGEIACRQLIDDDYLAEIEEMPNETCVCGFGLERLLMVLCGSEDIREVIWYPVVSALGCRP